MKDVAQKALDAGVKVVAFDVNLDNPNIPQVEQSDHLLARLALEQALKDNGEGFKAAYVYVAGFAPLNRRDEVWSEFKTKHPGVQEVARFGVVNGTTAASVADQAKAALRAHPEITVVFAPYDEFARGVKLAVSELGLSDKIKTYSADVSTADIREITEKDSPWVATVATNPAVVGAASIRAAALAVAGQNPGRQIVIEPTLLTQKALRELKRQHGRGGVGQGSRLRQVERRQRHMDRRIALPITVLTHAGRRRRRQPHRTAGQLTPMVVQGAAAGSVERGADALSDCTQRYASRSHSPLNMCPPG